MQPLLKGHDPQVENCWSSSGGGGMQWERAWRARKWGGGRFYVLESSLEKVTLGQGVTGQLVECLSSMHEAFHLSPALCQTVGHGDTYLEVEAGE